LLAVVTHAEEYDISKLDSASAIITLFSSRFAARVFTPPFHFQGPHGHVLWQFQFLGHTKRNSHRFSILLGAFPRQVSRYEGAQI
jgi:hypothetical protein